MAIALLVGREDTFAFLSKMHASLEPLAAARKPDKTYLILANPVETVTRGAAKNPSIFDASKFQAEVQENYLWLVTNSSGRIEPIDSRGMVLEAVCAIIKQKVIRFIEGR